MKTRTIIESLEHDELVNLFSTATYGSQWLTIKKKKSDYYGTELEDEDDCREDIWAKILLSGKPVFAYDYYAEDEEDFFGSLPHVFKNGGMRYTLTLDDIKNGLQKCLDGNDGYLKRCALDLATEASSFDLEEAEALMQFILFGEVVYG